MAIIKPFPLVSLIIPAFNEERYIKHCLQSVLELDYPKDLLEIIVVDNGSTDKTTEIAQALGARVLVRPDVRVGAVRNFGVSNSSGELIAFLDSDCLPPKDWISSAIHHMKEKNTEVVGGVYLLRSNPSWIESSWVLNLTPNDRLNGNLVGGSILITRKAFEDVGGFDESLNAGEDTDLGRKLMQKGHNIFINNSLSVVHLGYPTTLTEFIKRQVWHASSYLHSRRKGRIDLLFLLTTLFLLFLMALPLSFFLSGQMVAVTLIGLAAMPIVLTVKRAVSADLATLRLDRYVKMYILDFSYLVGRALGLARALLVEMNIIGDKKRHY